MKYPAHVYVIIFGGAAKVYVGLSHNPEKRFATHQSLLRAGKHPVEDFQADYNNAEDKRLTFCVVDDVKSDSERFKEHQWQTRLRSYERDHGYNYKDPTARTEKEKADRKRRAKEYHKDRIRKAIHATQERSHNGPPHHSAPPRTHSRRKGETDGAN